MSWHEGAHAKKINVEEVNLDWMRVKGELSVEEASLWFTKFLANHPFLALKFLTGLEQVHAVQDILIRTWFQKDFNLLVAGRGFSKSFTVALFIILYALFAPGVRIIICSGSYRQAKMIFETIEKIIDSDKAGFLRQCCPKWGVSSGNPSKGTDRWKMTIGRSEITATPLTEKIRGYRAQVVVIDEFLAVPQKVVDEIIRPFLTVKRGNGIAQKKIQDAEQILINRGELQESQRTVFQNNKMIALSSATYEFEPLYKSTYQEYLKSIHNPNLTGVSHSVFRLGYKLAPEGLLELSNIEEAKRSLSKERFDREYNAVFTRESGGFFNIKHIMEATVPLGEEPKIRMKGRKDHEYIIAIDPNASAGSEDADNFSISVFEMAGNNSGIATLVHGFAHPKLEVKKKVEYLRYLMKNFNVPFLILDNAGGPRFLEEYNALVPDDEFIFLCDVDFSDDETFRQTRSNYNRGERKIAYSQVFKATWIRDANETLQGDIQHRKIMFASSIRFNDADVVMNANLMANVGDLDFTEMSDLIIGEEKRRLHVEHVDLVVETTAKELSLIQLKTDAVGNYRFDLPTEVKTSSGKNRARRDSYTSFLLGNWGRRLYLKLKSEEEDGEVFAGFFYKG